MLDASAEYEWFNSWACNTIMTGWEKARAWEAWIASAKQHEPPETTTPTDTATEVSGLLWRGNPVYRVSGKHGLWVAACNVSSGTPNWCDADAMVGGRSVRMLMVVRD